MIYKWELFYAVFDIVFIEWGFENTSAVKYFCIIAFFPPFYY